MRLVQCAREIALLLFFGDLWPFAFSINTTARMKKDVRTLPRLAPLLQQFVLRKRSRERLKMSSVELKIFFVLAMLWCAAAECNSSVGLENNKLPDRLIDASSYSNGHDPYLGRLNNAIRKINETKTVWGAWCAKDMDINQFLQIDLGSVRNVTGIATQGYHYGATVNSYQIMYSLNGKQWFQYKENGTNKIFTGNFDHNTIVRHLFDRRLAARFIRFNPRTWDTMICMRVDIYACEPPKSTTTLAPTTQEIPTKTTSSESTKTSAKVPDDKRKTDEIFVTPAETTTDSASFEERGNTGVSTCCSLSLLLVCIVLVLNNVFN